MKSFRILLVAVAIIVIGMAGCSKTGATGAIGLTGPAGPAGPDSVVYSPWIPLAFVFNSTNGEFEDTLITPSLTKDILDKGVILTYVNIIDSLGIYHVYNVSSSFFANAMIEDYSVGKINIIAGLDLSGLPYRYVTIPGNLVTGNSAERKYKGYSPAELKSMPFEKVQQVVMDKN